MDPLQNYYMPMFRMPLKQMDSFSQMLCLSLSELSATAPFDILLFSTFS